MPRHCFRQFGRCLKEPPHAYLRGEHVKSHIEINTLNARQTTKRNDRRVGVLRSTCSKTSAHSTIRLKAADLKATLTDPGRAEGFTKRVTRCPKELL